MKPLNEKLNLENKIIIFSYHIQSPLMERKASKFFLKKIHICIHIYRERKQANKPVVALLLVLLNYYCDDSYDPLCKFFNMYVHKYILKVHAKREFH